MRVRIELEDGTIITIERPGRGRVGIRSVVTQDGQGEASTESPWVVQTHAPEDFDLPAADEATDAGPVGGSSGEEEAKAMSRASAEFAGLAGEEEEVIDAGPAPVAGNGQEVVFTQRPEGPKPPAEGQKKRRSRKKS